MKYRIVHENKDWNRTIYLWKFRVEVQYLGFLWMCAFNAHDMDEAMEWIDRHRNPVVKVVQW